MQVQLTEDLVRSILPNTIITVDEEIPLSERIAPYFAESVDWLNARLLGYEDLDAYPEIANLAIRAALYDAVADALPSLDLVVTPTGLGVVSSEGLVPASKERIERLIQSLRDNRNTTIILLQQRCVGCRQWRESEIGQYFCSSFIPFLSDIPIVPGQDIFDAYDLARGIAIRFEALLSESYLGMQFMSEFRDGFFAGDYNTSHPVVAALRSEVRRAVHRHLPDKNYVCPNDHEVWHAAENILRIVRQDPNLSALWHRSTEGRFDVTPFKNTRKGGYFF